MATGTLQSDSHYATNQWKTIEIVFFGKANNAKTFYYGSISFPEDVSGGTLEIQVTNSYGQWYSDGLSHTLDFENAGITEYTYTYGNIAFISIPASNISSVSSVCWVRLHLNYRVT